MNPLRMIITTQTSLLEPCTMQTISADYSLEHTWLQCAHYLKRFALSLVTIMLVNRTWLQNMQYIMVHNMHNQRVNSEEKLLHTFESQLQKHLSSETSVQQDAFTGSGTPQNLSHYPNTVTTPWIFTFLKECLFFSAINGIADTKLLERFHSCFVFYRLLWIICLFTNPWYGWPLH